MSTRRLDSTDTGRACGALGTPMFNFRIAR